MANSYQTAARTAVMKANAAQIDTISTLMAVVTMGSPMSFGERGQESASTRLFSSRNEFILKALMKCKISDIFEQFQMAGTVEATLGKKQNYAYLVVKKGKWRLLIGQWRMNDCEGVENAR